MLEHQDAWSFGKGRIVLDLDRGLEAGDDVGRKDCIGSKFVVAVGRNAQLALRRKCLHSFERRARGSVSRVAVGASRNLDLEAPNAPTKHFHCNQFHSQPTQDSGL